MLNQFYEYISSQILSFFEKESAKPGTNRYYLHLPSNEHVKELYDVLANHEKSEQFNYQHPEGLSTYATISLPFNGKSYVIATTGPDITIDFLVTLRNEMSEQIGQWKDTALLFISNTMNDSIRGGSIDLTSEGLPLHVKELIGNLDEMVQQSTISGAEKEMIRHYLNNRLSDYAIEDASFLDFEDILAILHKENMSETDYLNLHYFPDATLNEKIKERDSNPFGSKGWKDLQKEINSRLTKNNLQHEEVDRMRSLGNGKENLIEKFDNGGESLWGEEWYTIDFSSIEKWEEKVKSTKDIEFLPEKMTVNKQDNHDSEIKTKLEYWKRPKSTTAAGRRNWNIIVFHPNYQVEDEIEITLPFDRSTAEKFLTGASQKTTKRKGHSIVSTVKLKQAGSTFQRVSYKHEDTAKGNYQFNIAVIAWQPNMLKNQSDSYEVKTTPKHEQAIQFTLDESTLNLGNTEVNNSVQLTENQQVLEIKDGAEITFEPGILEEGEMSLRFILKDGKNELPIEIKDDILKRIPISSQKLWEHKRIRQSSFYIDQDVSKVEIDHIPYSTFDKDRPFLKMEFDWLNQRMRQATISYDDLISNDLNLPENVAVAYDDFLNAVNETGTIPSLLYYSENVKEKAEDYIQSYIDAIEGIEENQVMTSSQKSLFYLGTILHHQKIYMTPFSPLNVVYQLELNKESKGESIDVNILQRLNAAFTLPYLVDGNGSLFKPTTEYPLPEWHTYLPHSNVTIGETNLYLAKVVEEKLDQFTNHYDYLFQMDPTVPILLNVIHIPNDVEVLRGIVEWLKKEIKRKNSLSGIRNVEITSYNDFADQINTFDLLNNASNVIELKERTGLTFAVNDFLEEDVLRSIQNSLHYTKRAINDEVKYAHITLYKMKGEEHVVRQITRDLPSSLNLNGLLTTNVFKKENNAYRIGFGTGESEFKRTQLTHFATKMNELALNMENKGQNPYVKNEAIALHSDTENQNYLSKLYEQSNWVTFIDPIVDLKYFQNTSRDLVIVHYSDQYSPSSYYDAITVTDKVNQYAHVIDEFLQSQKIEANNEEIEGIIRTFNTFNGEWLLRAVQNRSHDKREKMSVVSAIKIALNFFDKSDILWVPLSMEEIVRVTGNVKLSRKSGIFSGKTIGDKGNCSDDLLMMGLEQTEGKLYVHMYPVEVKIGDNSSSVIDKGIKQVHELKRRLDDYLINDSSFDAKFLRNFFMRLFINNAEKIVQNKVWPERDYHLTSSVIDKLLNDEFEIVNSLQADFGSGLIISFRKETESHVHHRNQGVVILEYPEYYGYKSLPLPIGEIDNLFTEYINKPVHHEKEVNTDDLEVKEINKDDHQYDSENYETRDTDENEKQIELEEGTNLVKKVRPLIGLTNKTPIHWEFNKLPNRHLVIGGRSGQGKTYFMQALLQDLSKMNQSAVVIDYSSSYTPNQLDPAFVEKVGSNLRERLVYNEGFPLNPFLLRDKEVAGNIFKETPFEAAERVSGVFSSVYRTFGPQQKAALSDATLNGIKKHKEKMTMSLLLEEIEALENYSNQVITSISTRLRQFIHNDPFDYENENQWDEYFSPGGKITIIQLAGYDQDEVKRLLAEFILWDLWYYSQDRTEDNPLPVIMDEAQNLDFSDGSPAAKILREGRKFGWSVWFATQTFTNFKKEELSILDNAATKIYFNPAESEIHVIASRIGNADPEELRLLRKGQCLVIGQFAQQDGKLGLPSYHVVDVLAIDSPERE